MVPLYRVAMYAMKMIAKWMFDMDVTRQNLTDRFEMAIGHKLMRYPGNVLNVVVLLVLITEHDVVGSAPVSTLSQSKRCNERNYCGLL